MSQKKILVWLSGGVDSAVSAYLLKEQGHDVSAGFMINYLTEDDSCPTRTDMAVAKEVAAYLQIPFFTFDFIEEYERKVLKYIFEGYKKWLTPNPDVFCNTWVKFDLFREEALSYGFDAVATGHYARISEQVQNTKYKIQNDKKEEISLNSPLEWGGGTMGTNMGVSGNSLLGTHHSSLLRWIDPDKDQSYFLAALSREQLEQAIFPIGNLPKSEVRAIARKAWLPNAERKDSQWLCFVGKVNFWEFLKAHIPAKKWNIVTTEGNIIGEHDGAFQYTIWQRKGIGVGGGPALYVVEKNVENNTIIVWEEDDPRLLSTTCTVWELNWLEDVSLPLNCEAQIRYRQEAQKCSLAEVQNTISPSFSDEVQRRSENPSLAIENKDNNNLDSRVKHENDGQHFSINSLVIEVSFENPQRAITPGQVCVFYDGETVLGSGIIMM